MKNKGTDRQIKGQIVSNKKTTSRKKMTDKNKGERIKNNKGQTGRQNTYALHSQSE